MSALERPLSEIFPKIIQLPSGLKLEACLTPPGPVSELDEECGRGAAQLPGKRLAVCLHPWARLGGNMNDPCVSHPPQSLNGRNVPLTDWSYNKQGPPGTRAPAHALPQIPRVALQRARCGSLLRLEVIHGAARGRGSTRARAVCAQETWRRASGRIYRALLPPPPPFPSHPSPALPSALPPLPARTPETCTHLLTTCTLQHRGTQMAHLLRRCIPYYRRTYAPHTS